MSFDKVKAFGEQIKSVKGVTVNDGGKYGLSAKAMKVTPHPVVRANGGVPGTLSSKKIRPQRG